jgi:hypothetical protein
MKLIHGILGCVLAAGLTAHAASGTVISNTVFTPLDIKLKVQYNNSSGHVRAMAVTSKDLLKLLGYPASYRLATDYDGFGDAADVYVIDKNSVVEDLTSNDVLSVNFDETVNRYEIENGKTGAYADGESGVLSMTLDFTNIIEAGVADGEPPIGNEFSFEASGVYDWHKIGATIKEGRQKTSTKLRATGMVGVGSDTTIAPTLVPDVQFYLKDNIGDFLIKDGSVDGKGGGIVTNSID